MATTHMPDWIHTALGERLEGVSRKDLAARATTISERYRARRGSEAITSERDALAYTLTRMPATYAAVRRALLEAAARCEGFAPASLLDVGAGPGTAAWAALETWGSLKRVTLLDQNTHLLGLARQIGAACASHPAIEFLTGSAPGALDKLAKADLVTASYAFAELPEQQAMRVLQGLWERTGLTLALIEPGAPDGFRRLLGCRSWLLAQGAEIAAPCTHAGACPLATATRWCHFNERLPRRRDHQLVKSAEVNYEDERFCYLIATRQAPAQTEARRILATPLINKQEVRLTLCAPDTVEERTIARRDKEAYKAARHYDWGEAVTL